ncbi:MAG: TRAP transporter small permease [Alphaproteobacteria bacterium]|nr:TRAP transporter small permease [Alphaproteobacteria bacterium]
MNKMLDCLENRFNQFLVGLAVLVASSIGALAVLIPLNLFLTKAGLGNLWWLYGSIEYVLYFGVFLAAPWVLQQGSHVSVDLLSSSLPEPAAKILDKIINLLGASICLVLIVYGTRATFIEYIDQTMPDKDIQIFNWIITSVFTLSFAMSAVEFLMRLRFKRVLILKSDDFVLDGS